MAWSVNKQDKLTTSSAQAELLAISQTVKETIYLSCLMQAFKFGIPEALKIECENSQTIRLLVDQSMKLKTKLRHVDFHSYWLRQKVHCSLIYIRWVLTKKMVADGLTKALSSAQKRDLFVKITGIEDQKALSASIKRGKGILQKVQTDAQ